MLLEDLKSILIKTFWWVKITNKIQIKESVEKAFKVEVLQVRTMNIRGKKKRLGRHQGRKSNWKKALITLKEGQTIEYFEGA